MIELEKNRNIKKQIQNLIQNNENNEAKELLKEYARVAPFDLDYYIMMGVLDFMTQNLKGAEKNLLYAYDKLEFNFDVNYNLGIVYMYMGEYEKALEFLLRSVCIDNSQKDLVLKDIQTIYSIYQDTNKLNNIKENIMNKFGNYQRQFPKKDSKNNYVGDYFIINNQKYFTGSYDYYCAERDGIMLENTPELIKLYKTETLKAQEYCDYNIKTKYDSLIPIMVLRFNQNVKICHDDEEILLNNLIPNRYYYYRLPKNESINITSDERFILGELIELKISKKPKLILNIFIDGLSKDFIKEKNLKEIMPNTYNFFEKGTICENTYVAGEWTYVSIANIFTGLYTSKHKVFNPDYDTDNLMKNQLFSEVFKREGYYTAQINGDWRSTPTLGYIKGIDRYIYQPAVRGMCVDEIISETLEHLHAFNEKNNFLWIGIPDLHDIADEYESRISVQAKMSLEDRIVNKSSETSVRKKFDINKINRYKVQLERIDTYLALLYSYIFNNYNEDDYIISLISDHGQGYLIKSDEFLDEERTKVPMMFRGRNIKQGKCLEMIQSIDLFPIILNVLGIKNIDLKEANTPKYFGGKKERKFTYSESIFPGSPYRAVINDLEHKIFFETKDNCQKDGRFKIDGYEFKLINKVTNRDETTHFQEKVDRYLQIIFEHIKEYIIF